MSHFRASSFRVSLSGNFSLGTWRSTGVEISSSFLGSHEFHLRYASPKSVSMRCPVTEVTTIVTIMPSKLNGNSYFGLYCERVRSEEAG